MQELRYERTIKFCPFCAEPLPKEKPLEEHFIVAYADMRFPSAQVLFASLVCRKIAEELEKRYGSRLNIPEDEAGSVTAWIPVQVRYVDLDGLSPLGKACTGTESVH